MFIQGIGHLLLYFLQYPVSLQDNSIAVYKRCICVIIFLISPGKHVVGTYQKRLMEALLMSTHNIYFHGEIRKISGPSCSKLTTSLVNDSLKFTSSDTQIC